MEEHLVAGAITRELRRLCAASPRQRRFPALVHVGDPTGERVTAVAHDWYDAGARRDQVVRALEALAPTPATPTRVWLWRPGELDPLDTDWDWLSAARAGFAVHGQELAGFHLLTRHGWHNLVDGTRAEWPRVRPARPHRV